MTKSEEAARALMTSARLARMAGFIPLDPDQDAASDDAIATMDFALSIGGDGTFLRAAQAVREHGVPLFGINTGRLGFLTGGTPESAEDDVARLIDGQGRISERMMLRGDAMRGGEVIGSVYAANEIAVIKESPSQPIDVELTASGDSLYRVLANGVLVSTPTGSTGYALSSGGPIVHPDVRCLLVVPICPHSLYIRPIVLASSEVVEISLAGGSGMTTLSGDGQANVPLEVGDTARVETDPTRTVRIMTLGDSSYCDILRSKFDWGSAGPRETRER